MRVVHASVLAFDKCLALNPLMPDAPRTVVDDERLLAFLTDPRIRPNSPRILLWWLNHAVVLGPAGAPPCTSTVPQIQDMMARMYELIRSGGTIADQVRLLDQTCEQLEAMALPSLFVAAGQCLLRGLDYNRTTAAEFVKVATLVSDFSHGRLPDSMQDLLIDVAVLSRTPNRARLTDAWAQSVARARGGGQAVADRWQLWLGFGMGALVAILSQLGPDGLMPVVTSVDATGMPVGVADITKIDPTPPTREDMTATEEHRPLWAAALAYQLVQAVTHGDEDRRRELLGLVRDGSRREVPIVLVSVLAEWVRGSLPLYDVELPE